MSQRTPVTREVIVLGATPDAGWVVSELLDLACKVHWVGGKSSLQPGPVRDEHLATYEGFALCSLVGHVGSFQARLRRDQETVTVHASAIVVATGNERYYPDGVYGVPLAARVLTVSQIERQLAAPRGTATALAHRHERLALLLDLGKESGKQVASEALRLAIRLREEWHGEVYVFYRNLKVDTYGLERLTREMRQCGVVFCRYGDVTVSSDDSGVTLNYLEGPLRVDWLILPEAVRPAPDTTRLARVLQVRVGEDGYFQDVNIHQLRPGLSNRRGIFFAGRCHLDCNDEEARADAAQAAANVGALLDPGFLEPDAVIAHVDPEKCIRCLTCIRTCPHVAVELAHYDDITAARVVELACQGCGACVCNCPVRAIDLVGQTMPAWTQHT